MRNIRRAKTFDSTVKQLCEFQSADLGRPAFKTYRDLYVFAALLGFETEQRGTVGNDFHELDSRPFSSDDPTMEAMLSLALADTESKDVLTTEKEEEVANIFEQYLAGGLELISRWCAERATDDTGVKAIVAGMIDKKLLLEREGSDAGDVVF